MTAVEHKTVTLRGSLVEHKTLTADGWGKGELRIDRETWPVTLVGKLLNVRVGDTVEVMGEYTEHPRFGLQFKVRSCTPQQPDSNEGAVLWLSSRLPDVGPKRAAALVAAFGDKLWTTIESDHTQLTSVEGITLERATAIAEAYREVSGEREHMVLLRGWGLTDNQIGRCVATWGKLPTVVEHVRADPFDLANVVDGFGFLRADKVARKMGVKPDAPSRIRAAILYTLDVGATEGHCFLWGAKLRDMAARMLGVDAKLVVTQIFAVCEMQRVVRRGARVYASRIDRAEHACAQAISRLLAVGTGTET